ncbi:DivIVA domain-containing protein [Micromonospora phytophila]|uniref:DivIVA domain-containing protein n=1 Tax=Micromonospora phytophila TaxID=709888 RepID=UPI00203073A1|nr:DivIVA domain-containing protein [Micromonospora phytophila]MCM0677771.1 DivIVA domain-containing protein [Micromonospora phytophila]
MGQVLLLLVVALTVAAVVFGVTVLVTGRDTGLAPAEPDGRAVPLPGARPLRESDVGDVRFDTALRGYRMAQVDQAMRRAAYDIGYKSELIGVLEAEVTALREGRTADADALRRAREQAAGPAAVPPAAETRDEASIDGDAAQPTSTGGAGTAAPTVVATSASPSGAGGSTGDGPAGGSDRPGGAPAVRTGPGAGDGHEPGDDATTAGDTARHAPAVRSESA